MRKKLSLVFMGALLMGGTILPFVDPVQQAKKTNKPIVVFFTKNSCPFCVWLKPVFNQLQTKASGTQFLVVNVGSNPAYYKRTYGIRTVPTVIYYNKNGQEVGRHGSNNKTIKLSQMQQLLQRASV